MKVDYKTELTIMKISCSGSKDLASSSTLLSAPIRWNLARGRNFFEISFEIHSFLRRRRSKEQSGPKRFREFWRLHFFPRWPSSSLKSLIFFFSPAQDNNLAVSLNKKRNDSIAFFNRWFQLKNSTLYRCLLSMEPKIDSRFCRVPIKPDLSQKNTKQHKSQRMKAALPCCCSTTKSLS